MLADFFTIVDASDISSGQLQNAIIKPNINYHLCPAEETPFKDNSFDLITVATAYHWLDLEGFRKEAIRVGKPGAVVAAWAYELIRCGDTAINKIIDHFYYDITAPYWHSERRYVDERYATVPFDFEPLPARDFMNEVEWTKEAFRGFLQSWSAVQSYSKREGTSPLRLISEDLDKAWDDASSKKFYFPLFLRIGRIPT